MLQWKVAFDSCTILQDKLNLSCNYSRSLWNMDLGTDLEMHLECKNRFLSGKNFKFSYLDNLVS